MTKLHSLYGSLVALITPFNQDGSIDFETFKKLVQLHLDSNTQGLILAGTTGEGATLTFEEITQLFETAKQINQNKMALVLGLAANATHKAVVELTRLAALKPDAVMVLSPYYNKPPQTGIFAHFAELNKIGIPLIAYNVPGRTGSNIEAATTLRMAQTLK
jgi:4-hydroxy-tetrahydrodipicolinate synthase